MRTELFRSDSLDVVSYSPAMFPYTVRQLEVFLAVCDAGSFRRAAEALSVSEAGVSAHMRLLEEQLGCLLFTRRRGAAISLSSAGISFRGEVAAFVAMGSSLGRSLRQTAHPLTLRCYVGEHILEDYVRPALSEFLRHNPDIVFSFPRFSSREEVRRAVRTGELDGALIAVRGEEELPGSVLLSHVGSGIYGRPELKALAMRHGLGSLHHLVSAYDVGGVGSHERAIRALGVDKVKIAARYPYHDVGVGMALQGLGAIMVLDSIIEAFDPHRELVLIQSTGTWERRLFLADTLDRGITQRVMAFFKQALG